MILILLILFFFRQNMMESCFTKLFYYFIILDTVKNDLFNHFIFFIVNYFVFEAFFFIELNFIF